MLVFLVKMYTLITYYSRIRSATHSLRGRYPSTWLWVAPTHSRTPFDSPAQSVQRKLTCKPLLSEIIFAYWLRYLELMRSPSFPLPIPGVHPCCFPPPSLTHPMEPLSLGGILRNAGWRPPSSSSSSPPGLHWTEPRGNGKYPELLHILLGQQNKFKSRTLYKEYSIWSQDMF